MGGGLSLNFPLSEFTQNNSRNTFVITLIINAGKQEHTEQKCWLFLQLPCRGAAPCITLLVKKIPPILDTTSKIKAVRNIYFTLR